MRILINKWSSYLKENAKKAKWNICSIDVHDLNESSDRKLFLATGKTRKELLDQNDPWFILKSNCSFKTIPLSIINEADQIKEYITFNVASEHITSINQFANRLKSNKNLGDWIVAYYLPVDEGADIKDEIRKYEDDNIIPLNFIRGETEHVVVITNSEIAKTCRLEPGKFYWYFKPSYLNGFENLVDKDLNIEYLQAFEGIWRDEFLAKFDYLSSTEFMDEIANNEMQFTEKLINDHFDHAFDRTTNTVFIMNPNFKSRWLSNDAELPQCFVYVPDEYMKKYIFEIKKAIEDYKDSFEFVFCWDRDVAGRYIFLDEYPDVMPVFIIVDKSKKLPIRTIDAPPVKKFSELIVNSEDVPPGKDFYYAKYKEPIFLSDLVKDVDSFLSKFLEGKLNPYYQTEKMVQKTFVKEIWGDNFEQEIVNNDKVEQCIIEVFKHDCPSCMYNGKVFNVFSRKLDKYGLREKLPWYRLWIDNKVPYLGTFFYSPIYFYLKKEDGKLTEIAILDIPVKFNDFISKIKEYSGLEKELSQIDLVPKLQVRYHFTMRDLDDDFEIDLDLKEKDQEEEKERKEKERVEKEKEKQENEKVTVSTENKS